MRRILNKYPRLVFLLIGLIVGLGATLLVQRNADRMVREYQKINELVIEEYKTKVETQTLAINKLRNENKQLKSRTHTTKITRPDGSSEEHITSEIESETNITERMELKYEKKMAEEIKKIEKKHSKEIEKIISERKKLNVSAGITTELDWIVHSSYNIAGPFTIGIGTSNGNIYFGTIGVNL